MTLRPEFSAINQEFNDFLFAYIGDEENGMPLSVMSALTRLGIDPWELAARLAALPIAAAVSTLAPTIAQLPAGTWASSDATSIAARLIKLLPRRGATALPRIGRRRGALVTSRTILWLICLGMAALGFVGMAMNGVLPWSENRDAASTSEAVSPPRAHP